MEDALRELDRLTDKLDNITVLILVLMEDALRVAGVVGKVVETEKS